MNGFYRIALAMVLAAGLGACVREKLPDCPPMQVTLTVKDKNYFNIDDAVKLGLAERKADDLPFRDYIHTLYYVVHDAEGRVVAEQKNTEVTGDAQTQVVSLPVELPYGTYTVTVWGNMKSEEPLGDNPTSAELEETGAAFNDVYLASGTFHYAYGKENHELALERTKGNLLIKAEGIPDNIDFSTKNVEDVFESVDAFFSYSGLTDIYTELEWEVRNEIQSQTLMCPSPSYEGTTLGVSFIDRSAVAAQQAGSRAVATRPVLEPEDVHITMGRNEITILKYVYDTAEDGFNIFLRVNDRWEQIHSMVVD
mgnify:CR=1 FL=1